VLAEIVRAARADGANALIGRFIPTDRNMMVARHYEKLGFTSLGENETGETLWQTRLGTTVMGYPVTFTAGGRQYVAVTTGATGGGSPRVVPRTIIPEVRMPATGNALYVFALPERGR